MPKVLMSCVLLFVTMAAQAAPVEWELNNIQLMDPGLELNLVTGSFIYEADTQAITNVNFSGLPESGRAYDLLYGIDVTGDGSSIVFTESAVASVSELSAYSGVAMLFGLTDALTNSGGVTTLLEGEGPGPLALLDNPSSIAGCIDGIDNCQFTFGVYTTLDYQVGPYTGGTLVGTVVPVPAAVWLFSSALAGLGWVKRKRTV